MKYEDFRLTSMASDSDRARPDGGIDALEPPPIDMMDEKTLKRRDSVPDRPRLKTVVRLFSHPALAVGRDYDPFFGYLYPEVPDKMALPALDEVGATVRYEVADGGSRMSIPTIERKQSPQNAVYLCSVEGSDGTQ